jgi:predicted nucleic acid-binding protein
MIIVDTGFWVALFNNKDQYHLIAQQTLAQYSSQPLITTWCVLTESCHLLLQRSQKFLLFHLENTHLERIQYLMKQYQSLPMDLADASLVILAEELGNGLILSIDNRDFNTYRWKNKKPFINLFSNF